MRDIAARGLAVAVVTTLAACGGGSDSASVLAGSTIAPAPPPSTTTPAPSPPPAPSPAPTPAPPSVAPPTSAPPTIVSFAAAASGVTPALVGGSMTVAGDGNVWFSAGFTPNQIGRITAAGAVSYPVTSNTSLGAFVTGPLTTGADGNLWFCDPNAGISNAGTIGTIDVHTAVASEYATPLTLHTAQTTASTAQDQTCNSVSCTPVPTGSCVATGHVTCQTVKGGPTPVAACTNTPSSLANQYTTTTCATSAAAAAVNTCAAIAPTAANAYVTTSCTGITPSAQAYAITSGPDGNLWFTEYASARVGRFNATTKAAVEFGPLTAPARGIAAGPDGNVWFVENVGSTAIPVVGRITPAGVITEYSQGLSAGTTLGSIVAGADGSVWFGIYGGSGSGIAKIDPASGAITLYTSGFFGQTPLIGGLTLGGDGNVWFTDYYEGLVGRITPSGSIAEYGTVAPGSQLNAITAGPAGAATKTIWFTDPTGQRIGRATLP